MKHLKKSTAGVLVFLLSLFSLPAQAQFAVMCVNCSTNIQQAAIAATLSSMLTALTVQVPGAIQGAAASTSTATMEAGRAIVEGTARAQTNLERGRIESQYQPIDPCSVTAMSKGGTASERVRPHGSGRGAGGGGSGGSTTASAGATSEMRRALEISSGERVAPAPEVSAALASKGACSTFAKGGVREQACRSAGFSTGLSSGLPNADVRAETLFDGPQTQADMNVGVVRKLTIRGGNSTERTAVASFIRNLETPLDLRALEEKELKSEAGRNYLALRDTYEAAMSLATKPMRDQESMITANTATKPILEQLLKGDDAEYIKAYLGQAYPRWKTDGISYAELINLEAVRRYHNERWHERMVAAPEKALMYEQVQLQAMNNYMLALALDRLQQISVVQGNAAGASIRAEKLPALVAAHKAAQR
ncbi:hypothetical protein KBW71_00510 [Hydrogenophaga aromaticivorans]|uniref:hypothetical protein n=1 Tax=Hydrogenophaga aromaticivorans TaxID=2610898 RepID=UPI001B38AC59|nr:hypothetical protein [Hydrogenophaga aromaticivorans]MBQ0916932.1 hypothetical protein [Hydrogenophaga aromaticivorans]